METPLMKSAVAGNVSQVRSLISQFSGRQNEAGFTALMRAISYRQVEAAKLLIESEAGAAADNGQTALMLAAQYGFTELVERLIPIEAGRQNKSGWTALMLALNSRQRKAARLLALHEIGFQNVDGWTALMFAAQAGYADIASLLTAEQKKQSNKGWTALMVAADSGTAEICKLLVSAEAGMRRTDGGTAMMIAAKNGYVDIVRMLIDREFGLRTLKGKLAHSFAKASNHREICLLLSEEAKSGTTVPATNQVSVPIEQTLQLTDLTKQELGVETLTLWRQDAPALIESTDNLDINALKVAVDILTTRLNSANERIASLQDTVCAQASQIAELYQLVDNLSQGNENCMFESKEYTSLPEADANITSIPIHPDNSEQTFNTDPTLFTLPDNCLHSAEPLAEARMPEEEQQDGNNETDVNNLGEEKEESDACSIDIVCLPCEHICHFESMKELDSNRVCVICLSPIQDYIEVNSK